MAYTQINASVIDQTMTLTNVPKLASGGVKEIQVSFTFCDLWAGTSQKTAVFFRDKAHVYHVDFTGSNCVAPWEPFDTEGVVYMGVLATYSDGTTRTTEAMPLQVVQGAITKANAAASAPDLYTALEARVVALEQGAAGGSTEASGADTVYTGNDSGVQSYIYGLAKEGHTTARFRGTHMVAEKIKVPANMTIEGGTFVAASSFRDAIFSAQGDGIRLVGVTMKAQALDQTPSIYTENGRTTTAKDSNVLGLYSSGKNGLAMIDCVMDKIIPMRVNGGSLEVRGCRITDCSMFVWATDCKVTAAGNEVHICNTGLDYYYHVYYLDKNAELYASNNHIWCDTDVAYVDIYHLMTAGNKGEYRATGIVDGDVIHGNFQQLIDCHYADLVLKNCTIVNTNTGEWSEFGNMSCSSFRFEDCHLDLTGAVGQTFSGSMINGRDIPAVSDPELWKASGYDTQYAQYAGCKIYRTSHLPKYATFERCDIHMTLGTDVTVLVNYTDVVGCDITVSGITTKTVQQVDGVDKLVTTLVKSPARVAQAADSDAKLDFIGNRVTFVHPNTSSYLFRFGTLDGMVCNNTFSGLKAGTKLWYNDTPLGTSENNVLREATA